jgi:hypothetical protein
VNIRTWTTGVCSRRERGLLWMASSETRQVRPNPKLLFMLLGSVLMDRAVGRVPSQHYLVRSVRAPEAWGLCPATCNRPSRGWGARLWRVLRGAVQRVRDARMRHGAACLARREGRRPAAIVRSRWAAPREDG